MERSNNPYSYNISLRSVNSCNSSVTLWVTPSFTKGRLLLCSPRDSAAGEIIWRHFYGHLIAREDADEVHSQLA